MSETAKVLATALIVAAFLSGLIAGFKFGLDEGIKAGLDARTVLIVPVRQERLPLGGGKVVFVPNKADWDSVRVLVERQLSK
jgi:hypothetical protein